MSLTINAKTYAADSYQKDVVSYVGPLKTITVKDDMSLSRIAPKGTTTFSGVAKCNAKLTRTLALTGALTPLADAIINVGASVPVGFASADVDTMCNDLGAYISSASFKSLVKAGLINY